MNQRKVVVIDLLKKRHLSYLGLDESEVAKKPFWHSIKPISQENYYEWIEYGVNVISSEMNINRKDAEKEMSWIENEYGIKIK